ncbi:nucleotidyl transferase AbiEii/AbiGii toxin family protein [Enterococcus sp. DIV0756]|uniref:nucleotidyl transferase AbiEii/AbiGii toxin family protein n=1 Tax=Enterococcus sp. DIV0756 TaxID=2774636 RepID=UPI003F682D99
MQNRTTTDLDTTLRDIQVTKERVEQIFNDLTKHPTKEGIQFRWLAIEETRLEDFYPGFKISMQANLEKTRVPFSIDLTTGDSIVPDVIKHEHKLMFEDKSVEIYVYPTEQIIADKLHAAVHFGLVNSRSKDFYDLYKLSKSEEVSDKELYQSSRNTFNRKGMPDSFEKYYLERVQEFGKSRELKDFWKKYQSDNPFAQQISYEDTIRAIDFYFEILLKEEN